jgi:aerobic carbon-monoxide dehydrogenase large subunit
MSYVGAALSPRETKKLVLGRGSYIGDLTMPGLLHAAFVRTPTRGFFGSTSTRHAGSLASSRC